MRNGTHGVLGDAFHLIDRFGGIGVADEFGVEIARVVGRFEWKTEIVHGENVFEKFRFPEIANAASLAGGVKFARERVGASVKVVIVERFVNANAPENDAGMVPIAPYHAADIIDGDQFPGFIADAKPGISSRTRAHSSHVQEMARLGIVRGTNDVALEFVAKDVGVTAGSGHGLADKRKSLVTVKAAELDISRSAEALIAKEACGNRW